MYVICSLTLTTSLSGPARCNETDLSTRAELPATSRWCTAVLMVTTTEWMVHGVHCDTANDWPAVALCFVFAIRIACFQKWLIDTATTGDDADHST